MNNKIQKLTFTALMAAFICILAPISIPLPNPLPAITLATFAVYISAYIIGPWYSCAATLIYILLGCVGLPVFSKGQAGFQVVYGPTGGYIIGYFFIAIFTGLLVRRFEKKIYMHVIGMVIGTLCCYIIGTVWFMFVLKVNLASAIAMCVTPFLLTDGIKIVATTAICYPVRRQLIRLIPGAVLAQNC